MPKGRYKGVTKTFPLSCRQQFRALRTLDTVRVVDQVRNIVSLAQFGHLCRPALYETFHIVRSIYCIRWHSHKYVLYHICYVLMCYIQTRTLVLCFEVEFSL